MNAEQLAHLNKFTLILECDGWEDELAVEDRLDTGEDVVPEGVRKINRGDTTLEAQFHAPVSMITLTISHQGMKRKVGIFFLFVSHPEKILEWIVSVRDRLSLFNYADFLAGKQDLCTSILVAVSTPASCELKPVVFNG